MSDAPAQDGEYPVGTIVGSLVVGVFFGGVGGGVAFPTLPTLGTVLGLSPLVVGIILSANRVTRLVMSTPAGGIIDAHGARLPMVAGFFLQGTAPFGYILGLHAADIPLVGPAELFVAARVQWGVGAAFVFVGAYSTVVQVTTEANRGKWIGYFRGGQALGFPTGLVVGGLLADVYGYEVAFGAAGALGLVATAVAAVVIPDLALSVDEPAKLREIPGIVRADPRLLVIGSVNFTVRFLFAGILLATVVLYAEAYGIRIGEFSAVGVSGVLLALSILCASASTVLSGNISDRLDNRVLVTIPSFAALAFGFALLSAVPTLLATLVGVAVIGIGVGGTNPPLLAYLGDISPQADTGKLGGIYNAFGDIGSSAGPLVALPMVEFVGYRGGYLACAGLVVAVAILVIRTLIGDTRLTQTATAPDN